MARRCTQSREPVTTRGKCISVTDVEGRKTNVKKLLPVIGLESSTSFSISFKAGRLEYQPLFEKQALARPERAAEIEPTKQGAFPSTNIDKCDSRPGARGGGESAMFYTGRLRPTSNPLPFYIAFWQKR